MAGTHVLGSATFKSTQMTTATETLPTTFDATVFNTFVDSRSEPEWLVERRREAFGLYETLCEQPLDPEEYRRLNMQFFDVAKYSLPSEVGDVAAIETLLQNGSDFAGQIRHVNGQSVGSTLDADYSAKGVLFGEITSLLAEHRDLLEPYFLTRAVTPDADRFAAWHAAFMTGGTLLYVPRNVVLDRPLYSLIALAEKGAGDFSHTLVILEDGAEATLLEETASSDPKAKGLHCGAVELFVGQGANLRYVQLQNWNQKTEHFAHQSGRVERDGRLQWTVGGLGSKFAHIHQDVHLDGPGSTGQVNGVNFCTDRQVLSYYTQQTHHAPHTYSDLLYKEVCQDRSRSVWRGMIKVDEVAQKIDGYQRNDALILDEDCRVDAIPGLEIDADDVRCTHAATAGQVDEEQVFYAMCRGIERREAMHMIVEGFFSEVQDRIPVEAVRETLSSAVGRKLGLDK